MQEVLHWLAPISFAQDSFTQKNVDVLSPQPAVSFLHGAKTETDSRKTASSGCSDLGF